MKKEFQHTNKKLNESKVAADAAKRFKMLCEYTFNITEDDGEEEPQGEEQMPPEEGMNPNDNMGPGGENMEQPQMGGEEMSTEPQNGQQGGAPGFNPEPEMGNDEMDNTEPMQSDDEVIDVDELTQSQEETEAKVEDVEVSMEKGFNKLINVVDKLSK
jgi:hypothetical protein